MSSRPDSAARHAARTTGFTTESDTGAIGSSGRRGEPIPRHMLQMGPEQDAR